MSKSVVILLAKSVDFAATDEASAKFMKKAVVFANYAGGDTKEFSKIGNCTSIKLEELTESLLEATPIVMIEVDNANQAFAHVLENNMRSTLVVVATAKSLAMQGFGIDSKVNKVDRKVELSDAIATICYISDALLPENPTGAIIYQAMKDPNLKATELSKAKQTLDSMEEAISRQNRAPWGKHDCA